MTAVAPHSKGLVSVLRPAAGADFRQLPPAEVGGDPLAEVCEGRRASQGHPDPADWRVARSVFVADDLATAREYALGPAAPIVTTSPKSSTR